jgi:hypothetical protein
MPKTAEQKDTVRYDNAMLKITERGDGFLRAEVTMVEAGVYPYLTSDGSIILEAKLPEEIFNPITISTADGLIVTDQHPPKTENKGLVTPQTYKKYVKGAVSSPMKDGHRLRGIETVYDADLMESLNVGDKIEVSLGQQCIIDPTPGEYNGIRYNQAQRRIRFNHLAHVDRGRLGDKAKIHLDSEDLPEGAAVRVDNAEAIENAKIKIENQKLNKEQNMGDITLKQDSEEFNLWQSISKLFKKSGGGSGDQRNDGSDQGTGTQPPKTEPTQMEKTLQARIDQLEATVDTLTAQKEALKSEIEKIRSDAADQKDRGSVIETAKGIIKDIKTDGLSNREVMLKFIAEKMPYKAETKVDSLSDEVVRARFDAAVEVVKIAVAKDPDGEAGKTGQSQTTHDAEEIIKQKRAERLGLGKAGK